MHIFNVWTIIIQSVNIKEWKCWSYRLHKLGTPSFADGCTDRVDTLLDLHFTKAMQVNKTLMSYLFCFVCFVALRPKSTAMVMAGQSVHLTALFPGQAWTSSLQVLRAHTFACNWQQPFLNDSAEGRRMTVETISWSISTKVWDRARIQLATPWICSQTCICCQTRYQLRYPAPFNVFF